MTTCLIEIRSQTAAFRDPEFQNFHKTLALPSPTNIIGLVGAALGLPPVDAQTFFEQHQLRIGASAQFRGRGKDLWKYCKVQKRLWEYHPNFGTDSSIVFREFMYGYSLNLVFASNDQEAISIIAKGFENPFFGLTLGNSDALAQVVAIHQDTELGISDAVDNCYVEGDVMMQIKDRVSAAFNFSLSSAPSIHHLPIAFTYKTPYGSRQISKSKTYSIISGVANLNFAVEGVKYHDTFVPLISL